MTAPVSLERSFHTGAISVTYLSCSTQTSSAEW